MKRILIAGIGNIFHGDDAFGVEVVHALQRHPQPAGVTVIDFGIRSYDLAYALTDGYDAIILVDAISRGQVSGTVCLVEPDLKTLGEPGTGKVDPHAMDPVAVLQMAKSLGEIRGKLFLVGCEPAVLENDSGDLALSRSVEAALPQAIAMIQLLVVELLSESVKPEEPVLK